MAVTGKGGGPLAVTRTGPAAEWADASALEAAGIRLVDGRTPVVLILVDGRVPPTRGDVDLVEAVSGATCPYRRSHSCMISISVICDWSIFRESLSTCGLAPFASAIRAITMAWAWWAIIICMNSTSAFV